MDKWDIFFFFLLIIVVSGFLLIFLEASFSSSLPFVKFQLS